MTVEELRNAIADADPSALVCIDTQGYHRGIFPAGDEVQVLQLKMHADDTHGAVVIHPSSWPY